ncbi:MAG: class I SAM-dependent methyltransferase [Deltaproteobacteria bacterium]|nr:class I SAM-dependent methyltransferase [Deltaproteobacteria bacterium]
MTDHREKKFLEQYLRERPAAFAFWRLLEYRAYKETELVSPILDLGCGDGLFGSHLYPGHFVVGVDQSCDELLRLRSDRRAKAYASTCVASASDLPFRDGAFRTVVANCVLEHVADLARTLAETRRVLSPGGCLLATVPSDRFGDLLAGRRWLARLGAPTASSFYQGLVNRLLDHKHLLSATAWSRLLEEAGFGEVAIKGLVTTAQLSLFEAGMALAFPAFVHRRLRGTWKVVPKPQLARVLERLAPVSPPPTNEAAAFLIVARA